MQVLSQEQKLINSNILTSILAGIIYQECMDKLKITNFYSKENKHLMNRLEKPLSDFLNKGAEHCFQDFKGFYCLQDNAKSFIRQMATVHIDQLSLFVEVAELIKSKGDWVACQLGIMKISSDEIEEWNERQAFTTKINALPFEEFKRLKDRLAK